jgi:cytochrome c553
MKGKVFLDIPPGLIIAPNLTKGRGGIGGRYVTLQDWERAIRHGVRPDGTVLLPFMPYDFFNRLSDEDVVSVAAYLANLPGADNELPATKLRLAGYTMMGMPGSNRERLIAKRNNPPTTPTRGATAEYGRYIASTACVGCHSENMSGGPHHNPEGKPAPGVKHVGAWSQEDFIRAIRTGVAPVNRVLTDWMPWKKFALLADDELIALHEYIKTL